MFGFQGSRIGESFSRGRRDSRCGLRGVRVGEASNPGPTPLSKLWRVGMGMRVSSASRGRGEVEDSVSSNDDAHGLAGGCDSFQTSTTKIDRPRCTPRSEGFVVRPNGGIVVGSSGFGRS